MPLIMRLLGMASGEATPYDGQWLVEYDPTRAGVDSSGRPMLAHVVTTDDPGSARQFADLQEVHACWRTDSGLPYPRSRPLTAFTIAAEQAPDAGEWP